MLLRRHTPPSQAAHPPARMLRVAQMPDRIYAIGDIHGCYAQLMDLEQQIRADARRSGGAALVVVLGDMVDRGPDSAKVIEHLSAPMGDGLTRVCLRGNHEDMMVQFWDDPMAHAVWLDHGGRATLASYGVPLEDAVPSAKGLDHMRAAIPAAHMQFIRNCPYGLITPDAVLCHAAIDPRRPMQAQRAQDLLWGDPTQIADGDLDVLLVHGHIPVPNGGRFGQRINLDSHCHATGRLTAMCLGKNGDVNFLVSERAGAVCE